MTTMMSRPYFIKSGAYVSQFGGAYLRKAFGIQLFELAPIPDSRHHEEELNSVQNVLKCRQPAPKRIDVGYEDRTVRGID